MYFENFRWLSWITELRLSKHRDDDPRQRLDDISDSSMDERAGAEIQDEIDRSDNDKWITACFVEPEHSSDSERADRTEDQLQNATSDKGYVEEDQSQTNIHYTIATGAGEGAGNR